MKISINQPCHENWDKMTPNDKGAFCLACQKTVIDFSSKTIDEIKTFFVLKPKTESVCGRFRKKQLHELSFDEFITEFMSWKFLKRAAVICFLVLGTSLLSSCSKEPEREELMGIIAAPHDTTQVKHVITDTLSALPKHQNTLIINDSLKTKKIKKEKKKKCEQLPEEPLHLKGDISVS